MSKILIVPGNGGSGDIRPCNFYGWAEKELLARGYDVVLPGPNGMPDPIGAKENIWIPHIKNNMGAGEDSVVIGHSSGAAAALRLAETTKLAGIVLVAAYDSDLGDENERASGYFSRPFDWNAIQSNCGFVIQFAGSSDSLVPISVQRSVSEKLSPACNYIEIAGGDHFFSPPFAQLIEVIEKHAPCTK